MTKHILTSAEKDLFHAAGLSRGALDAFGYSITDPRERLSADKILTLRSVEDVRQLLEDRIEVKYLKVIDMWAITNPFSKEAEIRADIWESLERAGQLALLGHECRHWEQMRGWPPRTFAAAYVGLGAAWWAYTLVRHQRLMAANEHPLERPAYETGRKVLELVRKQSGNRAT